jgi:uncharacterized protein DUF6754
LSSHSQTRLRHRIAVLSLFISIFLFSFQTAIYAQDLPDAKAMADSVGAMIDQPVSPKHRPVVDLIAKDNPNDGGGAVLVKWGLSPDDTGDGTITAYVVCRSESAEGPFEIVGDVTSGIGLYIDGRASDTTSYYYKVVPISGLIGNWTATPEILAMVSKVGPITPNAQWFDFRRINVFVWTVLLCFFIIFYIYQAKSGKTYYIRKIAGMEAVDEAVGRATEMGRKIFYVPGINDMDNVQTIASMTILGRVAELAGQYETWLEVPVCRSLVLVTAKEVVKEAYTKVGRPDSFQENQVHYITDDQFGYAAAIDGMVVREKPATIFYMGAFFAESLILAETGNATGAIQIAGTAMPSQLPFFVAACDYTLIGEELFAASAYLSKEPKQLGSLRGQDVGKAIILVSILVGVLLETFGVWHFSSLFSVIG